MIRVQKITGLPKQASQKHLEHTTFTTFQVSRCFRLCLARPPQSREIATLSTLLSTARAYYQQHPDEAKELAGEGESAAETAAWAATARIVLNTDEFITRE